MLLSPPGNLYFPKNDQILGAFLFNFNTTYKSLPDNFYATVQAAHFPGPQLISFNKELATELALDYRDYSDEQLAQVFSGQFSYPESPIAQAYAGHQFGNFVPQLGDGRAMLLGEIVTPKGGRKDIQLKGSGRTPFSRRGDGKSSLGPVIREYIVSEAMHHLGIPTTRALCAVRTGEDVYRDDVYPGGVFTRVASSHIRIGTFQYLAARGDFEGVKALVEYAIDRHYPQIRNESESLYLSFLKNVAEAQASLVSKWMGAGFIHGVMNTDNMAISGETIDYGPCAFMDEFEFHKVFSSIDQFGRYSYQNQGKIFLWNLARLADCLIPLMEVKEDQAIESCQSILEETKASFESKLHEEMAQKLGLTKESAFSEEAIKKWLHYLEKEGLDFTLSFRYLSNIIGVEKVSDQNEFKVTDEFEKFFEVWKKGLNERGGEYENYINDMNLKNPLFIPRNHQVEKAIELSYRGDYSLFHRMNKVLKAPYSTDKSNENLAQAPLPRERVRRTFCGT